ncbi:MAG: phosphoenolpyruvate--protein phosphotransferase [Clostridiales bacterium]|nr:phosphoenolpyruvate--protein phosphotransferase [Clostridiales bacterium]
MKKIIGLAGSTGCVVGSAVVFATKELSLNAVLVEDVEKEIEAMDAARQKYDASLAELAATAGEGQGEIFEAYQEILADDAGFFDDVKATIRNERVCSSYAIEQKRIEVESIFMSIDDEYLKQRADDINNVCHELMAEIQGISGGDPFEGVEGESLIVFAEDLTPADTVRMDRSRLAGMVTEKGGVTSHTVILAKTLGVPAVVGAGAFLADITNGQNVILDGATGIVIVDPEESELKEFMVRKEAADKKKAIYDECMVKPAYSKDGFLTRVNVNTGDNESVENFKAANCDGVGLFRTEFLYMSQSDYPSEDFQFEAYKNLAEKCKDKELIIRTLDIGGDKQLDYMNLPVEANPFLGYRAIRLCLDRTDVFKTQLKAILRASAYGNVKIMFPMIVTVDEVKEAKAILETAKAELREQGIPFNENVPVGIMIETPAAVLLSDKLAQNVDFFSVGSNDLIQYTTASDRQNELVQYIYNNCNISVLRAINMVAENAHKHGIEIGICGEVGSEPRLIPLWLAMGIDELSVAASLVGRTKFILSQFSKEELQAVKDKVLDSEQIFEVIKTLDETLEKAGIDE